MRYIALLRGINVGGKNKLPMPTLREIFSDHGCREVETYIQSGNVLFDASASLAKTLAGKVAQAIEAQLSLSVPVIIRSAKQFQAVARQHPLAAPGLTETMLHVMFLADKPKPAAIRNLDPNRSPGDTFEVVGQEIYIASPNGVAGSKLTNAYIDKTLSTVSTARNWKTVQKLSQMIES